MDSEQVTRGEKAPHAEAHSGAVRHPGDDAGADGGLVAAAGSGARTTTGCWRSRTAFAKCRSWRRAGKLFDREGRLLVDNYPSVSCFLVREQNRNVDADLPLIARVCTSTWISCGRRCGTIGLRPGISRSRSSRTSRADEQAFIEAHRNELPELETHRRGAAALSAGWICGAPDRLRGRGERRGSEPAALCRL